MHGADGGVSLHVWMTPLFGFMLNAGCRDVLGVKPCASMRSWNRLPALASLDLLDRDLKEKRLTEELKQASY